MCVSRMKRQGIIKNPGVMRTGALRYCYEKKKTLRLNFIRTAVNGFRFWFSFKRYWIAKNGTT